MGSLIERDLDYSNLVVLISQAADALSDSKSKSLNDGTRKELSQACEHLASQLRPPTKRIEDLTYAWTEISAIKIAIDMGIFDLIANSRSPEDGFTASEIATGLKGDAVLIERVLRSLMLSGLFSMTPTNRYKPDPSVREFASGGLMKDRIIVAWYETQYHMISLSKKTNWLASSDVVHPVGLKLPEFLAKSQYQSPENPYAGPFQFTFQTSDHCFTWLKNHPVQQSAFNGLMQSTIQNRPSRWFENFPAADRFQRFRESTAGHETLQLVDIGGGIGHDILGLTKHLPDLHANFILQETPQVLDNMLAELHALSAEKQTIQPMPHDFFGVQPVTGAHVYFLGRVLHTWPNSQCRRILAHIKEAMTQDSVLLIHDRVFPDTTTASDLSRSDTAADFIMMVLHTAMERSEAQFADLLASAGLRLVAVWKPQGKKDSMERVLEAVRDEQ